MQSMSEQSLEDIDVQARNIARAHLDGEFEDFEVRERFADLIFRTKVAHDVARSRRVEATSHWDDLEGMVCEALTIKTYTSADKGGLDIGRIASGASLTGWARQMGKCIAASKHRDLRVVTDRAMPFSVVGSPEEPTPFEHISVAVAPAEQDVLSKHEEAVLELFDVAQDQARSEAGRVRAQARALRLAYHLPSATASPDFEIVYKARQAREADPSIALNSLLRRNTSSAHPILSSMWASYTDRDSRVVQDLSRQWGDQVADLLLAEKLVAEPRPALTVIRPVKTYLSGMSRTTGWGMAVERLLEAYLAVSCTPMCSGDHRTESAKRNELLVQRHETAMSWNRVVFEHLAAYPESPVGLDSSEIAENLAGLFDEAIEDPKGFAATHR